MNPSGGRPSRLAARWEALPVPARAAIHATLGTLFFAAMSLLIRHIADSLHVLQIVFFRNFLAILWMLPWFLSIGPTALRTTRLGAYSLRAVLGLFGMTAGFMSYTMIPLADATALTFTAPLFATAIAALFLGEVVRIRRWTAIVVGLIGTMIVLRPGVEAIQLGALLALLNAVTMAINNIITQSLARTESTGAIVTYMVLLMAPLSLVPALFVWEWPDWSTLFWLFALAGTGTIGHWYVTRAYVNADVTFVMPFDFLRLPLTALFAWLIFAELPTLYTWIGGTVIFASTFYIVWRESRLAAEGELEQATPPAGGAPAPAPERRPV